MKIRTGLMKMLRLVTRKRQVDDLNQSDKSVDDKVTEEMAKKIVDDARKHRLAISEELKEDT